MKIVEAIPVNHPQRSEEWFQARLGHVTASEVKKTFIEISSITRSAMLRILLDVSAINVAVKKTEAFMELDALDNEVILQKVLEIDPEFKIPETLERMNYRKQKVAEIVYGMRVDEDKYITNAMLWGQVSEEFAKTMFQLRTGHIIEEAVFKKHPTIRCGASPDGHIPSMTKKTIAEIKSLTPANHLFNVMLDPRLVVEEYYDQMQMQMWLENAEQCQFIGGDSRAPEGLKIYAEIIERDEQRIAEIEASIIKFNEEVDRDVKRLFAVAQSYRKAGIV